MSFPPEVNSATISSPGLSHIENNQEKSLEKSRQCPICKVYYKYGNSYWQHVRYVHANFLSQCIICGKSYKRMTMAKQHVLHFHKIAWHLCSNYVKKVKKNDHQLLSKIKEKSLERRKNNLKYFKKKTLHLISSFNCYDCPQAFNTINDLFDHVRVHRNKQDVDGEIESDAEDMCEISDNKIKEFQNGLLKEIKNIQKESTNKGEEMQNGATSEAEDIQNASVIEIEDSQNESVHLVKDIHNESVCEIKDTHNESICEIKEIMNGSVTEFNSIQSLLKNDVALKIQ